MEYAYSVIYSRALPDARDGLKPVQRRILYQMFEMGLLPDRGHVKSARVVGEVMGKLHPHGDSSIYDALVRLAQSFTLRLPLVDGHGNFGSLDDGPAAARYTEARLAPSAVLMNESIDEEVVAFVPNYDGQIMQPEVLPAAIPNLLVNGASGIAVGMATNLAPHNLGEVVSAAIHLIRHPNATTAALMKHVPGPDFPGGGILIGLDGVAEAYETGRGTFKVRARVEVGQVSARRTGLIVTELPFLVGPERVIEKIKQGIDAKKLSGISDVTDLTDRKHGLRLIITVKNGFNPEAVLEQLYRYTPLEDSFSVNSVALVNGQPQVMGLRDLLQVFVEHRLDVVTRRSRFRLAKRQRRLHLVDGLLLAIADIDEVIQLIRASEDADAARARLAEVFDLSREQAEYILELRLRRLTKFSRIELETEREQLLSEIAQLTKILESDDELRNVVISELTEVRKLHATDRRTELSGATIEEHRALSVNAIDNLELADEPCAVWLSADGNLVRSHADATQSPPTTAHAAVHSFVVTSTLGACVAVLSDGTAHRFTPSELPNSAEKLSFAKSVSARGYLGLEKRGPRVVGIFAADQETPVALFTAQGVVKRLAAGEFPSKTEGSLISLKPDDELVGAHTALDDDTLVLITSDAQLLRFAASSVRPQGKAAGGMTGIALHDECVVIAGVVVAADAFERATVCTVAAETDGALPGAESGSVKLTALAEFPAKGRATAGVRAHKFLKGENALQLASVSVEPVAALGADGKPVALPKELAKRDASGERVEILPAYLGWWPQ